MHSIILGNPCFGKQVAIRADQVKQGNQSYESITYWRNIGTEAGSKTSSLSITTDIWYNYGKPSNQSL